MSKLLRRRWPVSPSGGLSPRDRRGCEYDAYLPDLLADRRFRLDGDVAADVADAETAHEALHRLQNAGVVRQVSVGRRNRAYEAPAIIDEFTALERQLASGVRRYAAYAATATSTSTPHQKACSLTRGGPVFDGSQGSIEFGLRRMLDGIEALIVSRGA